MDDESRVIKEEIEEVMIGKEKWTIHMKGIPRLTEEDPVDAFARAFGFIKIDDDEKVV